MLEISPSTGAIVATFSNILSPNGGHPILAAAPSGLWLAPGVGGPAIVDRLTTRSRSPVPVFTGSTPGAILWLSVVGRYVWAEVASDGNGGRLGPVRLVALNGSGQEVHEVNPGQLGQSALAVTGDEMWAVTAGASCTGQQRLWRIDAQTGTVTVAASFASPAVPCPTDFGGSELAAVGRRVFVLNGGSSVLFRVTARRVTMP